MSRSSMGSMYSIMSSGTLDEEAPPLQKKRKKKRAFSFGKRKSHRLFHCKSKEVMSKEVGVVKDKCNR